MHAYVCDTCRAGRVATRVPAARAAVTARFYADEAGAFADKISLTFGAPSEVSVVPPPCPRSRSHLRLTSLVRPRSYFRLAAGATKKTMCVSES